MSDNSWAEDIGYGNRAEDRRIFETDGYPSIPENISINGSIYSLDAIYDNNLEYIFGYNEAGDRVELKRNGGVFEIIRITVEQ